jgi:hypothetical protein
VSRTAQNRYRDTASCAPRLVLCRYAACPPPAPHSSTLVPASRFEEVFEFALFTSHTPFAHKVVAACLGVRGQCQRGLELFSPLLALLFRRVRGHRAVIVVPRALAGAALRLQCRNRLQILSKVSALVHLLCKDTIQRTFSELGLLYKIESKVNALVY